MNTDPVAQARTLLVEATGLPTRWRHRDHFTVLETGFGLGNGFLATWQAWQEDPQRCARLTFISTESKPIAHADLAVAHAASPLREQADQLLEAWPPLTRNLHVLSFDAGRVRLLLGLGHVQAWLRELVAEVDAFYLTDADATWDTRMAKAIGRLAAPDATLAVRSLSPELHAGLTSVGFKFRADVDGPGLPIQAHFAPRFAPQRAPARAARFAPAQHRAVIVGAGLAGCASAWALAEQGWDCTLIERRTAPASEASGNAVGLFHGILNAHDGLHARFNRAAALAAHRAVEVAVREHGARGKTDGLLRLETELEAAQMMAVLERLNLPPDYVQAVSAADAGALCGITLTHPAWFYPGGGWVAPAALVRSFIQRAGRHVTARYGVSVQAIRQTGSGWALLGAQGELIDEAATVVVANAADALRLLRVSDWTVRLTRGQISGWPASAGAPTHSSAPRSRLPVTGAGYLTPVVDDIAWFGASSDVDDMDPSIREADQLNNIARLRQLIGPLPEVSLARLEGRTAWRCTASDRLPIIGAVPDPSALAVEVPDQVRFVPRLPGLHVFTALGSRGITWSALGAQVLAAGIAGVPMPLEASLLDAVDPARFAVRAKRRSAAG